MRNQTLEGEHEGARCGAFVMLHRLPIAVSKTANVHRTAVLGENAEWIGRDSMYCVYVGAYSIIRPFVTIDSGVERPTRVDRDCLIMAHVHIGHDAQVGSRTQIAPHASIGGLVTVGTDVKIGMGAVVKPHVTIGNGARIGMGAVVTKDVPAGEVWVGNPARRLEK